MTETRFTWRWLFVVAGVGIVMGLFLGLIVGWAFPVSSGASVDISALNAGAQNDYIVLVANSYAYDNDLPQARTRLASLKDSNIKARVERLAKALSTRQDPNAANVAELAVALGSTDSSLKVLSAAVKNPGTVPTKVARLEVDPTETPLPTIAPTQKPAATPTLEATDVPSATRTKAATTAAPKNTPKPAAPAPTTAPPAAAAAPQPQIQPDLSQWWDTQYIPANVGPGQQYWRLVYARYCDWAPNESFNKCQGMPGGIMDHTIYIMALDPSGACANNPTINIKLNDGSVAKYGSDKAKTIAYSWYQSPCMTDYEKEMYGEGNTVSVDGLPSDQITNLVLCSKNQPPGFNPPPCGHAHVHYFLVFQQATR